MAESDIKLQWVHDPTAPKITADQIKKFMNGYDSTITRMDGIDAYITGRATMAKYVGLLKGDNDMFRSKKKEIVEEIVTPEFPHTEKWIWVDGYKGTDRDMKCNGYQYIMNQQHNMEEGAEIEECRSGFHLCKTLQHVFNYYKIGNGHRFFKVKALVRKEDYEEYGARTSFWSIGGKDKLVAKSIIFEREMTVDEIFDGFEGMEDWSQEDKLLALEQSIKFVEHRNMTNELVKLGYSEVFAAYCASHNKYDKAYALGTQEGLSMDMKIFAIMVED